MTIAKLKELHLKVVHNRLEHKGKCELGKKDVNCLVCREETWIQKYPDDILNSVCSDCFLLNKEILCLSTTLN